MTATPAIEITCPCCSSRLFIRTALTPAAVELPRGSTPSEVGVEQGGPAPQLNRSRPVAPPAQAAECPEHHRAAPSKFGGLYCPVADPDTGVYCRWKRPAGNPDQARGGRRARVAAGVN